MHKKGDSVPECPCEYAHERSMCVFVRPPTTRAAATSRASECPPLSVPPPSRERRHGDTAAMRCHPLRYAARVARASPTAVPPRCALQERRAPRARRGPARRRCFRRHRGVGDCFPRHSQAHAKPNRRPATTSSTSLAAPPRPWVRRAMQAALRPLELLLTRWVGLSFAQARFSAPRLLSRPRARWASVRPIAAARATG